MRSKHILSIVIFFAAFALSSAFASQFITPSETSVKIERFLKQDVSNGYTLSREIYQLNDSNEMSAAKRTAIVGKYVDTSSSMDANDLPLDFQRAWHKHMRAWQNYADFLNEQRSSPVNSRDNESKLLDAVIHYDADITRTWHEVLRIADSYGTNVSGF